MSEEAGSKLIHGAILGKPHASLSELPSFSLLCEPLFSLAPAACPQLAEFKPMHLANTILALKKLNCKVREPVTWTCVA